MVCLLRKFVRTSLSDGVTIEVVGEKLIEKTARLMSMTVGSSARQQIIDAQIEAVKEENEKAEALRGDKQFEKRDNGGLYLSIEFGFRYLETGDQRLWTNHTTQNTDITDCA